jgi:hypothetical protein
MTILKREKSVWEQEEDYSKYYIVNAVLIIILFSMLANKIFSRALLC